MLTIQQSTRPVSITNQLSTNVELSRDRQVRVPARSLRALRVSAGAVHPSDCELCRLVARLDGA
jgi:hypothetical protein